MVLSDSKILEELNNRNIIIEGFNKDNLNPSSVDLTLNGTFKIYNAASTSYQKMWTGQFTYYGSSGQLVGNMGGQWAGGAYAITGFKVLWNSGNITSGSIKIYGIN